MWDIIVTGLVVIGLITIIGTVYVAASEYIEHKRIPKNIKPPSDPLLLKIWMKLKAQGLNPYIMIDWEKAEKELDDLRKRRVDNGKM